MTTKDNDLMVRDARAEAARAPHHDARRRPLGIRHSLARSFLAALEADVKANAADVIKEVRTQRALDYLKIVIGLLPNEIVNDDTGEMTNDERDELVRRIRDAIAARSGRPSDKPERAPGPGGA